MSPVHQSASWVNQRGRIVVQEQLFIEWQHWLVWSIQKSSARLSIMYFEMLMNTLISRVLGEANDKFMQLKAISPSMPVYMFEINWGKLFTSSLQAFDIDAAYKMPEAQMRQHDSVRRFQQLSLVPPAEQKIAYELTKQYIESVTIPSLPSSISSSVFSVSNGYLVYSQKLIWHSFEVMNNRFLSFAQTPFALTGEDKTFLGQNAEWDASKLDCTGYVFLTLRETQARGWIRASLQGRAYSQTEKFYGGHSIKILQEMDYRIVSDPDDGDLVVYFHGQPKSATHTGIYRDSGLVESKLGIGQTAITKHTIDGVSAINGRHILFFRKSPNVLSVVKPESGCTCNVKKNF